MRANEQQLESAGRHFAAYSDRNATAGKLLLFALEFVNTET